MENEAYVRLPVRYVYIYDSGPLCLISSVYLTDRAASVMAVLVASLEDLEDEVLYESTVMWYDVMRCDDKTSACYSVWLRVEFIVCYDIILWESCKLNYDTSHHIRT